MSIVSNSANLIGLSIVVRSCKFCVKGSQIIVIRGLISARRIGVSKKTSGNESQFKQLHFASFASYQGHAVAVARSEEYTV